MQLLEEARVMGKADPSIVDSFNRESLEARLDPKAKQAIDEMTSNPDLLNSVKAADGSLPGGLDPAMLQKLMGNPDVMRMIQNPKMQEVSCRVAIAKRLKV